MYDAAIGRWLSVDPYGQYDSPYMAMGNSPIMMVDPDGGKGRDWYEPLGGGKAVWLDGSGERAGYRHLGGDNYTFFGQNLPQVTVTSSLPAMWGYFHGRYNSAYSPWTGPDAFGIQASISANTIFSEGNLNVGFAFDNYGIGIYGNMNGGIGFDFRRLIPSFGTSISLVALDRNDPSVPQDLNIALSGTNISENIYTPLLNFGLSRPIASLKNREYQAGYNQYSIGLGTGIGYSRNLEISKGLILDFHKRRY